MIKKYLFAKTFEEFNERFPIGSKIKIKVESQTEIKTFKNEEDLNKLRYIYDSVEIYDKEKKTIICRKFYEIEETIDGYLYEYITGRYYPLKTSFDGCLDRILSF